MSLYSVDVEADGPVPGLYSMVQLGAVKVSKELDSSFLRNLRPITESWVPEALAACNFTRAQTLLHGDPKQAMIDFRDWVNETTVSHPVFISDNNGFDWSFVNHSFIYHLGLNSNPFGYSSRRIGDLYAGMTLKLKNGSRWKQYRKTKHTHNAKDDAMGNAEALIHMFSKHNVVWE